MTKNIGAFYVKVNEKTLDYRVGGTVELASVKKFFQGKTYKVKNLYSGGRHILGELEKGKTSFFLKLSTTEGISAVMQIERDWNEAFNKQVKRTSSNFWVPINYDMGEYRGNLFYLVTDKFEGQLLTSKPAKGANTSAIYQNIDNIIEFSKLIQGLRMKNMIRNYSTEKNYQTRFLDKSKAWLNSIPKDITKKYDISELLNLVINGAKKLKAKPRHGDFAPWHIISINTGELGLIDGEHAMTESVENYDTGYFIQRVFSVLEESKLAEKFLEKVLKRGYQIEKLKIILAARAIGGFLDESLKPSPNYSRANLFQKWILKSI